MSRAKKYVVVAGSILALVLGLEPVAATTLSRPVIQVVDTNPDPNIFEAEFSADEQDVTIDGTTVHVIIYKDVNNPGAYAGTPDGIPVPQIVVNVGDEVIVKLTSNIDPGCAAIACDTSIHWHGLELDNDSDGTGVTQNRLEPGDDYIYRFLAPRPGIFWFHPHMLPGPQTFAGVYGTFIVKDPDEATLQGTAKIPSAANTHTVVLSDIEYDGDGDVGYLDAGEAIPWATLKASCATGADNAACQAIADGDTVLVNGQKPTASTPKIFAKAGAGIRLRLLNLSTNRYFRLSVKDNGGDNNLYRIGGEGGFLEKVRLEGGVITGAGGTGWDTKYSLGEIAFGSSSRVDVVLVVEGSTGNTGDIITIEGLGYNRGGPSDNNPAGDLLHIEIDNSLVDTAFNIADGNDVLGAGGVEDLKGLAISDLFQDPVPIVDAGNPGSGAGSTNETITLDNLGAPASLSIDMVQGHFEDSGPDYTQVPYQATTRYAETGDVLELTIKNATNLHHPFHHHGFSFQPVRVVDSATTDTLYTWDYSEFQDVIDVFQGQHIVYRMRLDDRERITDDRPEGGAPAPDQLFLSGGAAGRWVFHCHLFLHATLGMISELVVVDTDRDGDGFDTSEDCDDFDSGVNPGAEEICDDVDDNCDGDTCCDISPKGQGYWHRQCLGVSSGDGGIDPGRNGRGPSSPTEPGFFPGLMDCGFDRLEAAGLFGLTTCEGMDADPPSNKCEQAEKKLTSLILNVCSQRLANGCEIDVAAQGCTSTTVGDLIDEVAGLIAANDCQTAAGCAEAVNDGTVVTPAPVTSSSSADTGLVKNSYDPQTGVGDSKLGSTTAVEASSAGYHQPATYFRTDSSEEATADARGSEETPAVVAGSILALETPARPESKSSEKQAADLPRSIEEQLALYREGGVPAETLQGAEGALFTALGGGYDLATRLRIAKALFEKVDVSLHSLLAGHLEDILDEARENDEKSVIKKTEKLLRKMEAAEQ